MNTWIFFISLFITGCQNFQIIDLNGETMGTTYSISIINQSGQTSDIKILQNKIDSVLIVINNIFSNYIQSSELSSINRYRSNEPIKISQEMKEARPKYFASKESYFGRN